MKFRGKSKFNEREVRRHYRLLRHERKEWMTEVKATIGRRTIGIGFFDNAEDFVRESYRYDGVANLYTGVNPRSMESLSKWRGLRNRIRTLFSEVASEDDVNVVTAVLAGKDTPLSINAQNHLKEVSMFSEGELFFLLDLPIPVDHENRARVKVSIARWLCGPTFRVPEYHLDRSVRIMGTRIVVGEEPGAVVRFKKYRPEPIRGLSRIILSA